MLPWNLCRSREYQSVYGLIRTDILDGTLDHYLGHDVLGEEVVNANKEIITF